MSYSIEVLADNPRAYFKLNETGTPGTYADSSGNGRTGTASGSLTNGLDSVLGLTGTSVGFSGGQINTDAVGGTNNQLTLEAWVKTTASTGHIFTSRTGGSGDDFTLGIGGGPVSGAAGHPFIGLDDDGVWSGIEITAANTVNDGQWHHLVGTWTGTAGAGINWDQFKIYVDGIQAVTRSIQYNTPTCSGNQGDPFGIGGGFVGQIDDAAIYGTELSATRIFKHWDGIHNLSLGIIAAGEDITGAAGITHPVDLSVAAGAENIISLGGLGLPVDLGTASTASDFATSASTRDGMDLIVNTDAGVTTTVRLFDKTPNLQAVADAGVTLSATMAISGNQLLGAVNATENITARVTLDGPQAVIEIAGSTHLPPVHGSTTSDLAFYSTTPLTPADHFIWPNVSPNFTFSSAGHPAPYKIQFQMSTSPIFTSIYWETILTRQVDSSHSLTAPMGIKQHTPYYWRTRAGDDVFWGAWSPVWIITCELDTSKAVEYIFENVGVLSTPYAGAPEYVLENVGVEVTFSSRGFEEILENVGVQITRDSHAFEYVYEGDVNTLTPKPHIWFMYKNYGTAGETTTIYGMGFGTLQSEYGAHPWIDWGPNFTTADVEMGVTDWHVVVGDTHALDDQRIITPGTDSTAPVVSMQHQMVTVFIPSTVMPSGAFCDDFIYIVHSGGTSNKAPFRVYSNKDVLLKVVGRARAVGWLRIVADPVDLSTMIEQLYAGFTLDSHIIAGPNMTEEPLLGAVARTSASVGTWTSDQSQASPLSVNIGAQYRWIADPAHIVPRLDLGTGVNIWTPSVGTGPGYWRMDLDSNPYIDVAYSHPSRDGEIDRPAMVFDGSSWLTASETFQSTPAFTIGIVAVLHVGQLSPKTTLMESWVDGEPAIGASPVDLTLTGEQLELSIGSAMSTDQVSSISGRPVIVMLSSDNISGVFAVLDGSPTFKTFNHPVVQAADLKFYLGRPVILGGGDNNARMDVLEIFTYNKAMTSSEMWQLANKLDSIYRISR